MTSQNRLRERAALTVSNIQRMGKWNDTDVPLAYLITFRTYGTWLHGDTRGSIDRNNNVFGSPKAESRIIREQQQVKKLKSEPVLLNAVMRGAVEEAIREVCAYRDWKLYAQNVRINHAHVVTAAKASADKVLNDLKAYSTRKMRQLGCWPHAHSPWVDKGSKRNLWNEDHIFNACDYVVNGQGGDLPKFD
ncbi:MAG: transposase [Pyrinomonadaceae bacterium]